MKGLVSIPFSSPWIVRNFLGRAKRVLDIGCGDGSLMLKVNHDRKYDVVGVDLSAKDLKKATITGVYNKLINKDVRKINFQKRSFDAVLASQVVEHLEKDDAATLIALMEKISKKTVIIGTTNGFFPYEPFEKDDKDLLHDHKSGWAIEEMEDLGYKVYGQGAGFIFRPKGLLYKHRRFKDILVLISFLLAPIIYFFPNLSAYIVAVKNIRKK